MSIVSKSPRPAAGGTDPAVSGIEGSARLGSYVDHDPATWFIAHGVPVQRSADGMSTDDVAAAMAATVPTGSARGRPTVVGIAGSVASGKSYLAEALVNRLNLVAGTDGGSVGLTTDGFIHPNVVLEARGLLDRKGYPESYDWPLLASRLAELKEHGTASWPTYSHAHYDRGEDVTVRASDVVVVEGINVLQPVEPFAGLLDRRVYLDASEPDLEHWFVERFMVTWDATRHDPTSFYHQWSSLDPGEARDLAVAVWQGVNRPNLREHIAPTRTRADLVLLQRADHTVVRLSVPA